MALQAVPASPAEVRQRVALEDLTTFRRETRGKLELLRAATEQQRGAQESTWEQLLRLREDLGRCQEETCEAQREARRLAASSLVTPSPGSGGELAERPTLSRTMENRFESLERAACAQREEAKLVAEELLRKMAELNDKLGSNMQALEDQLSEDLQNALGSAADQAVAEALRTEKDIEWKALLECEIFQERQARALLAEDLDGWMRGLRSELRSELELRREHTAKQLAAETLQASLVHELRGMKEEFGEGLQKAETAAESAARCASRAAAQARRCGGLQEERAQECEKDAASSAIERDRSTEAARQAAERACEEALEVARRLEKLDALHASSQEMVKYLSDRMQQTMEAVSTAKQYATRAVAGEIAAELAASEAVAFAKEAEVSARDREEKETAAAQLASEAAQAETCQVAQSCEKWREMHVEVTKKLQEIVWGIQQAKEAAGIAKQHECNATAANQLATRQAEMAANSVEKLQEVSQEGSRWLAEIEAASREAQQAADVVREREDNAVAAQQVADRVLSKASQVFESTERLHTICEEHQEQLDAVVFHIQHTKDAAEVAKQHDEHAMAAKDAAVLAARQAEKAAQTTEAWQHQCTEDMSRWSNEVSAAIHNAKQVAESVREHEEQALAAQLAAEAALVEASAQFAEKCHLRQAEDTAQLEDITQAILQAKDAAENAKQHEENAQAARQAAELAAGQTEKLSESTEALQQTILERSRCLVEVEARTRVAQEAADAAREHEQNAMAVLRAAQTTVAEASNGTNLARRCHTPSAEDAEQTDGISNLIQQAKETRDAVREHQEHATAAKLAAEYAAGQAERAALKIEELRQDAEEKTASLDEITAATRIAEAAAGSAQEHEQSAKAAQKAAEAAVAQSSNLLESVKRCNMAQDENFELLEQIASARKLAEESAKAARHHESHAIAAKMATEMAASQAAISKDESQQAAQENSSCVGQITRALEENAKAAQLAAEVAMTQASKVEDLSGACHRMCAEISRQFASGIHQATQAADASKQHEENAIAIKLVAESAADQAGRAATRLDEILTLTGNAQAAADLAREHEKNALAAQLAAEAAVAEASKVVASAEKRYAMHMNDAEKLDKSAITIDQTVVPADDAKPHRDTGMAATHATELATAQAEKAARSTEMLEARLDEIMAETRKAKEAADAVREREEKAVAAQLAVEATAAEVSKVAESIQQAHHEYLEKTAILAATEQAEDLQGPTLRAELQELRGLCEELLGMVSEHQQQHACGGCCVLQEELAALQARVECVEQRAFEGAFDEGETLLPELNEGCVEEYSSSGADGPGCQFDASSICALTGSPQTPCSREIGAQTSTSASGSPSPDDSAGAAYEEEAAVAEDAVDERTLQWEALRCHESELAQQRQFLETCRAELHALHQRLAATDPEPDRLASAEGALAGHQALLQGLRQDLAELQQAVQAHNVSGWEQEADLLGSVRQALELDLKDRAAAFEATAAAALEGAGLKGPDKEVLRRLESLEAAASDARAAAKDRVADVEEKLARLAGECQALRRQGKSWATEASEAAQAALANQLGEISKEVARGARRSEALAAETQKQCRQWVDAALGSLEDLAMRTKERFTALGQELKDADKAHTAQLPAAEPAMVEAPPAAPAGDVAMERLVNNGLREVRKLIAVVAKDCKATHNALASLDERLGEEVLRLGGELETLSDAQEQLASLVKKNLPRDDEPAPWKLGGSSSSNASLRQRGSSLAIELAAAKEDCCYQPVSSDGRRRGGARGEASTSATAARSSSNGGSRASSPREAVTTAAERKPAAKLPVTGLSAKSTNEAPPAAAPFELGEPLPRGPVEKEVSKEPPPAPGGTPASPAAAAAIQTPDLAELEAASPAGAAATTTSSSGLAGLLSPPASASPHAAG
eukprot:TRINITY_DN20059_c0_g1_i1.p1 TRINITY_DN20059_c0_g1~~TRINITY_DN20059_c0_g1_i1.p1  ORF type:complete len:2052 (+),score=639.49 TRINITY_DN20059_c0_g1_i1:463-6156(+)